MERFNLNTWLEDKSRKVIDDDGFPVEIIKWDANEKCPVVYLNHNGIAYNVSVDGMYDSDPNHGLFFADNELTEFEKALLAAFNCVAGKAVMTVGTASFQEDVDEWSKPLINLARKEIEKENPYNEKQKQEWSKEDSERLLRIHQFIWANRKGDTDEIYQQEQDADWLMTLKQ